MLSWLRKRMKIIMIAVVVVFAASILGIGGFSLRGLQEKKVGGFIKVNGKEVNVQRFNQIYARLRENYPAYLPPGQALMLQNLALNQTIDFAIILSEAKKKFRVPGHELNRALEDIAKGQKFSSVDELKKAVERSGIKWNELKRIIADEMLVNKMIMEVRGKITVSPNDLREVRARHILVKEEKQAKDLYEQVKKGGDFAKLAKKYSIDPGSKDKGGDLGFFSSGMMVKEFDQAAFSAKVGDIVGPVKTDFGYHIIKVEDARLRKVEGGDPEKMILEEKQNRAFNEWFYKLKKDAKVEIEDPALRALELRFKGKLEQAVEEYKKAISAAPTNAYLNVFLGSLYEDMGKKSLAIEEYKTAVKKQAGDPMLYVILGQAYTRLNQTALAEEQFKKASTIAGDRKVYHEEMLKVFNQMDLKSMAAMERREIERLEKREAYLKKVKEGTKVKTD